MWQATCRFVGAIRNCCLLLDSILSNRGGLSHHEEHGFLSFYHPPEVSHISEQCLCALCFLHTPLNRQ